MNLMFLSGTRMSQPVYRHQFTLSLYDELNTRDKFAGSL